MHLFVENKPVKRHNEFELSNLDSPLVCIEAIDKLLNNINASDSQTNPIKLRKISEAGNLKSQLNLNVGPQVMITLNIDINGRLVKGLAGRVTQFKYSNNIVRDVYV